MINIANLMHANGHEISIVQYYLKLPDRNSAPKIYDLPGIPISLIRTSFVNIHIKLFSTLFKTKYNLVYGNTHAGAFSSIMCKLKGIPLIMDMHGGLYEEFILNYPILKKYSKRYFQYILYRIIDFIDIHAANKILCPSRKMMQYLHNKQGVPLTKMAYVANGVDLEYFQIKNDQQSSALRKKFELEGKMIFGYIGASDKWQGFENFVKAAGLVEDRTIAFIFVGGNENKIDGNKLFISKQSRAELLNYYSMCDVLVLPRPNHLAAEMAAPTKFAEYASMSKPILTTEVGDAANLVKIYDCGIVVADNSPENLAQGIIEFNKKTADELKIMGCNARKLAEDEFDWNHVAKYLHQIILDFKR